MTRSHRQGWLLHLRRIAGLGPVLVVLLLMVGTVRAHALALAAAGDDLCTSMVYTGARIPVLPADPTDLADHRHACCDFGLCLDTGALAPAAPIAMLSHRVVRRADRRPAPRRPLARRRHSAAAPRAPPSTTSVPIAG